jgi:16S rRNA C967 or C1407 C5-methylase (RsmB/RsmF family)/NOL1/NOP2/fmu family ribosome biogenesis protein
MFPDAFRKRISQQQYLNAEELLRELEKPSPVTVRINRKKWNKNPELSIPVPWCKDGFYLETRPSFTLDPLFHSGCYYPQEASGMFLEQIYRQVAADTGYIKVLDLCGAPGGKSTHLSALIGDRGFLVANEVIRARASVLAENLTKWGFSNSIVTQSDPSAFSRLPGFFDIMLIDAPCSGEGMFRDQIAVNEWSEGNAVHCCERQKRILADAWPALKENGILIYSTCTFNPDENERNIKWLSEKQAAETIKLDISGYQGITEIDYEGIHGYGFYPGKINGEGLFFSVIRKKDKAVPAHYVKAEGKLRKPGKDETVRAAAMTNFTEESLIRINDGLYSVPCSYSDFSVLSKFLRMIKPGTGIFTLKKNDSVPSHDIAMSIQLRNSVYYTLNLDLDGALNYLRKENLSVTGAQAGWIMASYEDVNLGFLNNIGNRMNNYYPVDWRIRMKTTEKDPENLIIHWKHGS